MAVPAYQGVEEYLEGLHELTSSSVQNSGQSLHTGVTDVYCDCYD